MTTRPTPILTSSHPREFLQLSLLGWVLLLLWAGWWLVSLLEMKLLGGRITWIPAWNFLGLDFIHNYRATRFWLNGGNPYVTPFNDPVGTLFAYPPIVLPMFAWCRWLEETSAVWIWTLFAAGIFSVAGGIAGRTRGQLAIATLPASFVMAVFLWCAPVLFALERGQCDVIVLLAILIVAAKYSPDKTIWQDVVAGVAIAVATWTKCYPAILLPGMIVVRRPRAFFYGTILCLFIALASFDLTLQWIVKSSTVTGRYPMYSIPYAHSLSGVWPHVWAGVPLLGSVPGLLAAGGVLLPLAVIVSLAVYRSARRHRIALPYLLWLTAMATFWWPVSYDYKLFFLPLAALCVWDWRDGLLPNLALFILVLCLQPFQFKMDATLLLFLKLGGWFAVGYCLLQRAGELIQQERSEVGPGVHVIPASPPRRSRASGR